MAVEPRQLVVVGAGAAGVFGAIAAAQANPALAVTILEAGPAPLAKVRISGGGRCNVTHACFDPALLVTHYPRGARELRGAFSRFQPRDTLAWFEQRGVTLKREADGRIFPRSDDSATIIDCLLEEVARLGIALHLRQAVVQVERQGQGFGVTTRGGQRWYGDRLLLATGSGGVGYRLAQALGHTLVPPVPSLFTFTIPDPQLRSLAGVALPAVHLKLVLESAEPLEQTGALLITHWGMSGPAVLKLSAFGAMPLHRQGYRATLVVNWLPGRATPEQGRPASQPPVPGSAPRKQPDPRGSRQSPTSPDQWRQTLLAFKQEQGKRSLASATPCPLPRRLWQYLVQHRAGLPGDLTWASLSKPQLHRLLTCLTADAYAIAGKGVFKEEFVTCGGIDLREVNFQSLESRRCPGLYLAGELLNIDGITGGFNFQNAWTTGWLAGQGMAGTHLNNKTSAPDQTRHPARNRQND